MGTLCRAPARGPNPAQPTSRSCFLLSERQEKEGLTEGAVEVEFYRSLTD